MPKGVYNHFKQRGRKLVPFTEEHLRRMSEGHKGIKLSAATRLKLSIAKKGISVPHPKLSAETKKKISLRNMGRKVTVETRVKIGLANKGKIQWKSILAAAKANLGREWTLERRMKHRIAMQGVVNKGQFKVGLFGNDKPLETKWRQSAQYQKWRRAVGNRDKWECLQCGAKAQLHADHIKPYILYPELRYDITNGRILCADCHRKTDTYGGKIRKLISVKSNA